MTPPSPARGTRLRTPKEHPNPQHSKSEQRQAEKPVGVDNAENGQLRGGEHNRDAGTRKNKHLQQHDADEAFTPRRQSLRTVEKREQTTQRKEQDEPGSDGRGMSLTITPTWGSAASEAEQLWGAGDASKLVGSETFEAKTYLDTEIGYGLAAPHRWGVVTPYAGLTLSDGAQRTLRGGLRWNASDNATVALEAERQAQGEDGSPANAVMLRAAIRW